jgi:hypothetical protein
MGKGNWIAPDPADKLKGPIEMSETHSRITTVEMLLMSDSVN